MAQSDPPPNVSPITIATDLTGITFPASKARLVDHAREHHQGANPEPVLQLLDRLPDRTYGTMNEIEEEVGKLV